MPENPYGLEVPSTYHMLRVGIGMQGKKCLEETENLSYVWGKLTRHSVLIGYIALTPEKILVGSNHSISRIDRGYGDLLIRMGDRQALVGLINIAPKNVMAHQLLSFTRNMTPFQGVYTIDTVSSRMIEILSDY